MYNYLRKDFIQHSYYSLAERICTIAYSLTFLSAVSSSVKSACLFLPSSSLVVSWTSITNLVSSFSPATVSLSHEFSYNDTSYINPYCLLGKEDAVGIFMLIISTSFFLYYVPLFCNFSEVRSVIHLPSYYHKIRPTLLLCLYICHTFC